MGWSAVCNWWRTFIGVALILVSSVSCSDEVADTDVFSKPQINTAVIMRDRALESDLAYRLLESLTTEVGARPAGSLQDRAAVAWAISKFEDLNFDRVWAEEFPIQTWSRGEASAAILEPYPHALSVTALGNSPATASGGIEAEVIEFATFSDLQNADRKEVEGKIAFINDRMIRSESGSDYFRVVDGRMFGAIDAARKGAKALVVRSIGTDQNRLPHTGTMMIVDGEQTIPALALSAPDADLLQRVGSRGEPVKLRLKTSSSVSEEMNFSSNVIAEIQGSQKPNEIVLIGAHLDSWDLGTGAVDDGFGVAVVMAAAAMVGQLPTRPARTIRVVLFGAEELGLLGGRAYAAQQESLLDDHVVATELDFGAGRVRKFSSHVQPSSLPVVDQIASILKPLGIERGSNNSQGGPDIIPLSDKGVPVVLFEQDATNYFDIHHTANDTLDKVRPEDLRQTVSALSVFSYLAANSSAGFGDRLSKRPASPQSEQAIRFLSELE